MSPHIVYFSHNILFLHLKIHSQKPHDMCNMAVLTLRDLTQSLPEPILTNQNLKVQCPLATYTTEY